MKDETFNLYSVIKDTLVDWDVRHSKYGHFTFDTRHIKYFLGWSDSKIYRVFNNIKDLGIVRLIDNKRMLYELVGYKQVGSSSEPLAYISKLLQLFLENSKTPSTVINMQTELENMQQEIANLEMVHNDLRLAKAPKQSKYDRNVIARSNVIGSFHDIRSDNRSGDGNKIVGDDIDYKADQWEKEHLKNRLKVGLSKI